MMGFRGIALWLGLAWAFVVSAAYYHYNAPYYAEKVSAFGSFLLSGGR